MRPAEAVEVELHPLGVLELKFVGLPRCSREGLDPECGIYRYGVGVSTGGAGSKKRRVRGTSAGDRTVGGRDVDEGPVLHRLALNYRLPHDVSGLPTIHGLT